MSVDTDVLIVGAGPSGLGMAIQLVRNFGTRNFELIEKSSDVGGTWFLNSYPGCGCDVCTLAKLQNTAYGLILMNPGPISLLFLFICTKPLLVTKICSTTRDPSIFPVCCQRI